MSVHNTLSRFIICVYVTSLKDKLYTLYTFQTLMMQYTCVVCVCLFCLFWRYWTRGVIWNVKSIFHKALNDDIIAILFLRKSQCFTLNVECLARELLVSCLTLLVWRGPTMGVEPGTAQCWKQTQQHLRKNVVQ